MRAIHNSAVQDRTVHCWPSHIGTFSIKASTFIRLCYSMGAPPVSLQISPTLTCQSLVTKHHLMSCFWETCWHTTTYLHIWQTVSAASFIQTVTFVSACWMCPTGPWGHFVCSLTGWSVVVTDRLFTDTWSGKSEPKTPDLQDVQSTEKWQCTIDPLFDSAGWTWAAGSRPLCALHDYHTVLSQAVKCGHGLNRCNVSGTPSSGALYLVVRGIWGMIVV